MQLEATAHELGLGVTTTMSLEARAWGNLQRCHKKKGCEKVCAIGRYIRLISYLSMYDTCMHNGPVSSIPRGYYCTLSDSQWLSREGEGEGHLHMGVTATGLKCVQ